MAKPVQYLPIDLIEPNRRATVSPPIAGELEALADEIRREGMRRAVCVRLQEGRFEIVAGERRWEAARLAGLEAVPVIVINRG